MRSKLRLARELISDPENWCQGSEARDRNGISVNAVSKSAQRFCAVGACDRANAHASWGSLDEAAECLSEHSIVSAVSFNDSYTHDEVLWMFDLAIAIDEEERDEPLK